MNKKTFTLAVIFLICALGWLGANVYWRVTRSNCVNVFDLVVGVLFVAAGVGMVYNEFNKKKCRHLDEGEQAQNSLTDACDRPFSGRHGRRIFYRDPGFGLAGRRRRRRGHLVRSRDHGPGIRRDDRRRVAAPEKESYSK